MLNRNTKINDVLVTDNSIIIQFKKGAKRELIITEIVKIYLTINKKRNLISIVFFTSSLITLFYSLDESLLITIVFLYLIFIYFIFRNDKIFRFKYILIIQNSNSETYRFRFEYHLKDKIINAISSVKTKIK